VEAKIQLEKISLMSNHLQDDKIREGSGFHGLTTKRLVIIEKNGEKYSPSPAQKRGLKMAPPPCSLALLASLLKFLKNSFDDHYLLREVPQVRSQIQASKFIIRHDVQRNLPWALTLAQKEAEAGLRSSFLVDLNSPDLGVHEREAKTILHQINDLEHEVGLLLPLPEYCPSPKTRPTNFIPHLSILIHQMEELLEQPIFSLAFPDESLMYPEQSYFLATKICASSAFLSQWLLSDRLHNLHPQVWEREFSSPPDKILQLVLHPELWRD